MISPTYVYLFGGGRVKRLEGPTFGPSAGAPLRSALNLCTFAVTGAEFRKRRGWTLGFLGRIQRGGRQTTFGDGRKQARGAGRALFQAGGEGGQHPGPDGSRTSG